MYVFKVNGNSYKIRFGYGVLYKTDLIDRVIKATSGQTDEDGTPADVIKNLLGLTAELLLVGLQKYHSKEFGYKDEKEKLKRIDEILDLLDDYEDESTEEHEQDAATLLKDLQDELEKNGFLSTIAKMGQEMSQMEQTAQTAKTEMENESARVIAMTPTESK